MSHRLRTCVAVAAALGGAVACSGTDGVEPPSGREPSAITTGCPGDWQSVPTFSGLAGTYTRLWPAYAAPGEMTSLSIATAATSRDGRTGGSYARSVYLGAPPLQSGSYSAVGDNPAMGATIVFGDAAFPTTPAVDAYAVEGVQRSPLGAIVAMCVVKASRGGLPFTIVRVP